VTAVSYDDLVAAATVGLSHSPLPVTTLAGAAAGHEAVLAKDDQAAALLDAAALMTAARRAGLRPAAGVTVPPPAAAETAAELPAGAMRLVRRLGSRQLLMDLLAEAASRGYRAPAPLLPFLLDAAARDKAIRPAVAAVLGARGRWLAQYRPDWQQVADAGTTEAGAPDATAPDAGAPDTGARDAGASGDPGVPDVWETGSRARRRAYLTGLRHRDPAAARELLSASWRQETGPDREALLPLLAGGLSADDEAFLEQALDDPKESVRNVALGLLARLPDSAFRRRAAQRAAPLLRLDQHGAHLRLVASPPERADAAAVRDGISATPPRLDVGVRAWLLTQVIAAAPLASWVSSLRMDPDQIASLPVAGDMQTGDMQTGDMQTGDMRAEVHAGWRLAAVSQASAEWAEALLAVTEPAEARKRAQAVWPADSDLAALLPAGARAARAAALLAEPAVGPDQATEVARCARPWPEPLADAVITALRRAITSAARSSGSVASSIALITSLSTAAGHGVPVTSRTDYAAALAELASAENCPSALTRLLRQAADTAAVRRAFLEEIR
jgi:hypothetical protein